MIASDRLYVSRKERQYHMKILFGDLEVGEQFKRGNHELVWMKCEPFTAYGDMKNQNAMALYSHPLRSVWHYDRVSNEEEVTRVS